MSVEAFAAFPVHIALCVASAPAVGFSGSRVLSPLSLAALGALGALVHPRAAVSVGCASGADAAARALFPCASVFSVASGRWGSGPGAFAARSAACVRSVAAAGGVWCAFPASPCPVGVRPSASVSACFAGCGSGTWSSLALAVGLGLPCVVFAPAGAPGWLQPVGGGWFVSLPAASQPSLF